MESDFRHEVDAKLDAHQARLAQKLMEHGNDINLILDGFRLETAKMHQESAEMKAEMRVQFTRIDARFDCIQSELKSIRADFHSRLDSGIAHVVKWVVGLIGGAMISFVTVITFVLNNAS